MEETLRQADKGDKEQILKIAETVWEGNDYILRTVDTWLDPASGYILVVEKDQEIRAFGKMSYLTEQDFWLEGLRVKEQYRGLGYANLVTKELVAAAKRKNAGSLRFACHRKAVGSIRSGENHGFIRKGEFNFILCEKIPREKSSEKNTSEVFSLPMDQDPYTKIEEFPEFQQQLGFLFGSKWKFVPGNTSILQKLQREGKVLITKEGKDLLVYDQDGEDLRILFYGGTVEGVKALLRSLRERAPDKLMKTMTLPKSKFNPMFEALGFHMKGETVVELAPNVYLYEYPM